MAKQEIDFVYVIADDDFGIPGGMVRKGEPFRCTRKKAKELVGTKQAHYATPEELEALADASPVGTEGDPEKLDAKRDETQASDAGGDEGAQAAATEGEEGSTEDAPAKAEASKATKSTRSSK